MTQNLLALYNRLQQIHVLLDDGDRRSLGTTELSSPQYHLLMHLHTTGGARGLTITEIAELLICTRSNATRLVQRLEQQGLVQLHSAAEDRRLVLVTLSPAGEARFLEARALHYAAVKRRFGDLDTTTIQQLSHLTQSLVARLEEDLATFS